MRAGPPAGGAPPIPGGPPIGSPPAPPPAPPMPPASGPACCFCCCCLYFSSWLRAFLLKIASRTSQTSACWGINGGSFDGAPPPGAPPGGAPMPPPIGSPPGGAPPPIGGAPPGAPPGGAPAPPIGSSSVRRINCRNFIQGYLAALIAKIASAFGSKAEMSKSTLDETPYFPRMLCVAKTVVKRIPFLKE